MSSHVHLIVGRGKDEKIESIIRDVKKYTSVHICRAIEANQQESRREWMLWSLREQEKKVENIKSTCFGIMNIILSNYIL